MTTWDTAVALEVTSPTPLEVITKGKDAGVTKLSIELGKSDQFILDHLNLLKESELGEGGI